MVEIERSVPAGTIEQWVMHMRRQRSRAADALWLMERGHTVHDGVNGVPTSDATERHIAEQHQIIEDVNRLLMLYDELNLPGIAEPF
jgi:hypothetical protein